MIPPEVKDLLDGIRGITGEPPSIPRSGGSDPSTLLDYLLSP